MGLRFFLGKKGKTIKDNLLVFVLFFLQYLERSQLERTQDAFLQEITDLDLPIKDVRDMNKEERESEKEIISDDLIQDALEMFDNTYEDAFFKVRQSAKR